MAYQGHSFTLIFLLATLISLGESNTNRKLLQTPNNYQPLYSPLPSPVYSTPVDLPPSPSSVYSPPADLPPPPSQVYSPPADLPPLPTPVYPPPVDLPVPPTPIYLPPQAYKAFYYRKSPPPPPPPLSRQWVVKR
ncbi:hypothetical protein BRARA_A02800 [Brassica rapa]|uniref:Extensin domain-containing protein n=1 Tax=Brassica campestris TaxID=3711 RepID=A0A398AXD4_BRACM|nr:hypothetical protein BRARA_A02800 [Brassica rapa]